MSQWEPDRELTALMEKAKAKRLWFFSQYQLLWFSPFQLEENWKIGRFRWSGENWRLRPRQERLDEIDQEIRRLQVERCAVAAEIEEPTA